MIHGRRMYVGGIALASSARKNFRSVPLRDVRKLRDMHVEQHKGRGRPYSILTRSGIFLLCAAWELYCEEVIDECVELLIARFKLPTDLPDSIQKFIARSLKKETHELAALSLAGEGWKKYYRKQARVKLDALNTPKSTNVTDLFRELVGVDVTPVLNPINIKLLAFIAKRGDIAHQGAKAGHVSINDLNDDYIFVCNAVADLDNFLIDPLKALMGYRPWNRETAA